MAIAWSLPPHAYVPGQNARHPEGFFNDALAKDALAKNALAKDAWPYGLHLLREGFYWECHEVLEAVWMDAAPNSREKHLVQAIIHMANAALKMRMGKPNAAQRLADLAAMACQEAYGGLAASDRLMGLQRQEVQTAQALCADAAPDFSEFGASHGAQLA